MMNHTNTSNHQRGAVSIFIVIFTALLLTVVTVSFVRIMIRDQRQATNADLSQSALDSAQAGVEDAKRALAKYFAASPADRIAMQAAMEDCDSARQILYNSPPGAGENPIQTSSGDAKLDQAYTCVKIKVDTNNYEGMTDADTVNVIPLETGGQTFDRIHIKWFTAEDASITAADSFTVPASGGGSPTTLELPTGTNSWSATRPPVLEAQLMQFGQNTTLQDFDNGTALESSANTLFIYPQQLASPPSMDFATSDLRKSQSGLTPTQCFEEASRDYSCSAQIGVPDPIGGGNRTAYLRLVPRYNKASYEVTLWNSADTTNPVQFIGVQPEVDATGRANDLFRRVRVRIQTTADMPFPAAAVDVSNNLCKTFAVSESTSDYVPGTCNPNISG